MFKTPRGLMAKCSCEWQSWILQSQELPQDKMGGAGLKSDLK